MDLLALRDICDTVTELWTPKQIGLVNDTALRIAQLHGEFVWHRHPDEDEFFLVLKGEFDMQYRDRTVRVGEGEAILVPRGVEHCPKADDPCWVLLIERESTQQYGAPATG